MTLRLYDTAARAVRDFVPLEEGKVGIYVCGLTVQSEPHVGHVRSAVNFDVLRRWLVVSGYDVTFIRNITDIDDKILIKAAEQDRAWYNLAYDMKRELDKAYDALHVLPPTYEPAATGHVPEMLELIALLVERGHAYAAEDGSGDVYFDVQSWSSYGELTRQKVDDMEAAEDADPRGKRDPRDFALWKGHKESEPETASWAAPLGTRAPGLAHRVLGDGGEVPRPVVRHPRRRGRPALPPPRERAGPVAGCRAPVRVVLDAQRVDHHLRREDEQVARQLAAGAVGARAGARHRAALLHGGGALPLDGGVQLRGARGGRSRVPADRGIPGASGPSAADEVGQRPSRGDLPEAFARAMDDDLGTPAAVGVLHDTVRAGNKALADGDRETAAAHAAEVQQMLGVLGLDPAHPHWSDSSAPSDLTPVVDALVKGLLEQRAEARANKDFATADAIRDRIKDAGIEIEDTPDGPRWSV